MNIIGLRTRPKLLKNRFCAKYRCGSPKIIYFIFLGLAQGTICKFVFSVHGP